MVLVASLKFVSGFFALEHLAVVAVAAFDAVEVTGYVQAPCLSEWLRRLPLSLLKISRPTQRLDAGLGERDGEVNGAVAL